MARLHADGAKLSRTVSASNFRDGMAKLGASIRKGVPSIKVPDIARTLDWYTSIGFTEVG